VDNGFRAISARIDSVGQAFAGQQGIPSNLASTLTGAQAVDAGDAEWLTARIQSLMGQYVPSLNGLSTVLQQDAVRLKQQAETYRSNEQQNGQLIDQSRTKIE
jgi:hypothetical protein